MTEANYNAQKVEYNLTLQHTIASTLDGVIPERVTNIVVGPAPTPATTRQSKVKSHATIPATADAVSLKYTVTVRDPLLQLPELRTQLEAAVVSKEMDDNLHTTAAMFGVATLVNGTFAQPFVTSASPARAASSQLTGAMIAGLVIGVIFFVIMVGVLIAFAMRKDSEEKEAVPQTEVVQAEGV